MATLKLDGTSVETSTEKSVDTNIGGLVGKVRAGKTNLVHAIIMTGVLATGSAHAENTTPMTPSPEVSAPTVAPLIATIGGMPVYLGTTDGKYPLSVSTPTPAENIATGPAMTSGDVRIVPSNTAPQSSTLTPSPEVKSTDGTGLAMSPTVSVAPTAPVVSSSVSANAPSDKSPGYGQMTADGRDFTALSEKDVDGLNRPEKKAYYAWKSTQLDQAVVSINQNNQQKIDANLSKTVEKRGIDQAVVLKQIQDNQLGAKVIRLDQIQDKGQFVLSLVELKANDTQKIQEIRSRLKDGGDMSDLNTEDSGLKNVCNALLDAESGCPPLSAALLKDIANWAEKMKKG